jgi:dolichol kinase
MTQIDQGTIHYKDELVRKLIHLFSLSIPVVYYFISTESAALILGILTFIALALDIARHFLPKVGKLFYSIFGFILREHEVDTKQKNLNGATYVLISALIGVLIFPKLIFITAFSILIVSDTMAALIGRKFGRHKFLSKSFEGTLAFFVSACIVVFFTPKIGNFPEEYLIGIIGAMIGAIVENISFRLIDDNLSITICCRIFNVGFVFIHFTES